MKRFKNQNAHKRFWICFILKKNTARIGSGTGIKVLCAQYGLSDEIERALGLDPDDDGLLDGEEFGPNKNIPFDHDEDLVIDALDDDDDNDTIPTKIELSLSSDSEDTDEDGIKNWHDTDANGDGIPDREEGLGDLDGDGLTNKEESLLKTDPKNPDSDSDSLNDRVEVGGNILSPLDTDNDSIIDALDTDDDNDEIPTIKETADGNVFGNDIDEDKKMNWLDTDSDDDGLPDQEEGAHIANDNKTPAYLKANPKIDEKPLVQKVELSKSGNNIPATLNNLKEKSEDKLEKNSDKNSNDQFMYYIAFAVLVLVVFKLKKK